MAVQEMYIFLAILVDCTVLYTILDQHNETWQVFSHTEIPTFQWQYKPDNNDNDYESLWKMRMISSMMPMLNFTVHLNI